MGIESDQLVFDYLSRVGDLAQQRKLPSKARMGLVASLRDEIARQRKDGGGADSPAAVRRILARLGTPDAVVSAVEDGGPAVPGQRAAEDPEPRGAEDWGAEVWEAEARGAVTREAEARDPEGRGPEGLGAEGRGPEGLGAEEDPEARGPGSRKAGARGAERDPGPRGAEVRDAEVRGSGFRDPEEDAGSRDSGEARGPGSRGRGGGPGGPGQAAEPDWWSVVPGFTGGVEVPELLAPPEPAQDPAEAPEAKAGKPPGRGLRGLLRRRGGGRSEAVGTAAAPAAPAAGSGAVRGRRFPLRGRKAAPAPAAAPARGLGDPVLLLAAGCLVVGTVTGSWVALAAGWLLAYTTRRLSRGEAKWGVLGLPGAMAAGAAAWLWGRLDGRWGSRSRRTARP
ncbi:hypothetical protein LUW75_14120 [Streptomyces sp. MRC013]|uniref:hypothetical protein n=1 Tax=Streptomyces sp. MRC013 TaxID=2898276 RepID=UPI002025D3B4|nr:hypothetical protein [Streptomyces sp. MRC013]URM90934.1 hypothetical protein LUW75_14120 [Streptomyces sp. MRC013]